MVHSWLIHSFCSFLATQCIWVSLQTLNKLLVYKIQGFPGGSDDKEFTCNVGDLGLIPMLGRSPGEVIGYPLQYSGLENPTDRGAWWAIVHGVAKNQTRLSDFTFTSLISYLFAGSRQSVVLLLIFWSFCPQGTNFSCSHWGRVDGGLSVSCLRTFWAQPIWPSHPGLFVEWVSQRNKDSHAAASSGGLSVPDKLQGLPNQASLVPASQLPWICAYFPKLQPFPWILWAVWHSFS